MGMTLPCWISAAAALVTADVTRLVAPVWSFGPHGEAGTRVLQSVWAKANEVHPNNSVARPAALRILSVIIVLLLEAGELLAIPPLEAMLTTTASSYALRVPCQGIQTGFPESARSRIPQPQAFAGWHRHRS